MLHFGTISHAASPTESLLIFCLSKGCVLLGVTQGLLVVVHHWHFSRALLAQFHQFPVFASFLAFDITVDTLLLLIPSPDRG